MPLNYLSLSPHSPRKTKKMKKRLLIIILLLSSQFVHAQLIEDFESWNQFSIGTTQMTEPTGWSGSDSFIVGFGTALNPLGTFQPQIFQDNPGQTGTGALRITSKFQSNINAGGLNLPAKDYPGICTNSKIELDFVNNTFNQMGGTPISIKPVTTSMYIKNTIVGGDTNQITVLLIDDSNGGDSILASATVNISVNIPAFTKFTFPLFYINSNLIPTLIRYTISSSNPLALLDSTNSFSVHAGTKIVVDNIDVAFATGVRQLINSKKIAVVYPTKVHDVLYISLLESFLSEASVDIYQISGGLISTHSLQDKSNTISVNNLPSGIYIYSIKSKDVIYQTGKFVK